MRAFLQQYPELAAALADCFDGLQILNAGDSPPALLANSKPRSPLPESSGNRTAPLGDFQIVGEIARGGMGIVYEAVQLSLGRRVALKVLPFAATIDARHLQRFKIEAQAAALLHHTHIVPIYAVGCERGVHFYAMQLIEGQLLAAMLHQLREREGHVAARRDASGVDDNLIATHDPRIEVSPVGENGAMRATADVSMTVTAVHAITTESYLRRAVRLMIQAAEALEHAHQAGVAHRDIKPANLLIDRFGNLWITDFGLAQLKSDNGVTRSNDVIGTFRYMSPEQTGRPRMVLDHRTDLYSLGATFYELITLESPFTASTHQELLYQILHTEPRLLRELNRGVPPELETIVLKTLSKNPVERYGTAADLQRFLDHKPVLARRPSTLVGYENGRDEIRRWWRRRCCS